MKVGLILPLFSGKAERVLEAAREAEELGFDGAFVFDHFFPPGGPRDRPALEAFTTLAAVGAATRRITLGTLVTRASLRSAGLLAKTPGSTWPQGAGSFSGSAPGTRSIGGSMRLMESQCSDATSGEPISRRQFEP